LKTKDPAEVVTVFLLMPVRTPVTVAFAPGITPPFESETIPEIVPMLCCAFVLEHNQQMQRITAKKIGKRLFDCMT
jgi:hypothetical protein